MSSNARQKTSSKFQQLIIAPTTLLVSFYSRKEICFYFITLLFLITSSQSLALVMEYVVAIFPGWGVVDGVNKCVQATIDARHSWCMRPASKFRCLKVYQTEEKKPLVFYYFWYSLFKIFKIQCLNPHIIYSKTKFRVLVIKYYESN